MMAATPISLLDVPLEILLSILRYCMPSELAALCRTCKLFDSIARPQLYTDVKCDEEVVLVDDDGWRPKNYFVSFLGTIFRKPELGACVRCIDYGGNGCISLTEKTQSHTLQNLRDISRHLSVELASLDDSEYAKDETCESEEDLFPLLIPFVPNLKELILTVPYSPQIPGISPAICPPLRKLRSVSLINSDTENGFSLGNERCSLFLRLSPNLEKLTVHMCTSVGDELALPNLRILIFTFSNIGSADLDFIISCTPRLESFRYTSGGCIVSNDGEFSPAEATMSLSRQKRTLRLIDIVQDEALTVRYRPGTPWNGGAKSYRDFPVLETLVLAAVNIFPDLDEYLLYNNTTDLGPDEEVGGDESQVERDTRYIDLIPPSLRFFGVTGPSPLGSCIKLAAESAKGRFPNLKTVAFEAISDGEAALVEAAFAAAGVRCMTGFRGLSQRDEFNKDLLGL
jgi:hypothetical protein